VEHQCHRDCGTRGTGGCGSPGSRKIVSFGWDRHGKPVDYGSLVEEGTVLAQIDEALYQADVAQAEAQLGQAGAALEKAQADLVQLQAKYSQAERDWGRPQARSVGCALTGCL